MTIDEYKKNNSRIHHIVFPSGLELDIEFPSALQILQSGVIEDNTNPASIANKILTMIKFPDGFSADDLTFQDLTYLYNQIAAFFK